MDPSSDSSQKIEDHLTLESKIVYEDSIEDHVMHSTSLYSCSVCNTTFTSIEEHLNEFHQHENVFVDYNINESCNEINNLEDKGNVALEEKLSNSEYLSKESHSLIWTRDDISNLMVIHERVHSKSKPHSCKECGRCFRLRHSLISHMRIHTGERPFKCSSCNRTFRTKRLQRSHIATHSGLYQFKCRYCDKQFCSKDKVEVHENYHKKPFVCIDCERVFYSLGFAKKHMENHNNGQLKFTCNTCPNMFTRAAYLESHLRTKHCFDAHQ